MNAVELSLIIPVKDEEEAIDVFVARVVPILEGLDDPAARSSCRCFAMRWRAG